MELKDHDIIFFDGICGLCNRFVDWTIKRDKKHLFRFAPLQGKTALTLLHQPAADPQEWSVIFFDQSGVYQRSEASLRIIVKLGGFYGGFAKGLLIIPTRVRDFFYNIIARNRYKWFGKSSVCRIPKPEEKEMFLP